MPTDPVTDLVFADTHDVSFDVAFTTTSAGYAVSAKLGSGLAAPSTPTDEGWTLIEEYVAAPGARQVHVGSVAGQPPLLPGTVLYPDDVLTPDASGTLTIVNDEVYTVAVFGWNGAADYSSAETVDAHAIPVPVMLTSARDYALVEVTSNFEGLHIAIEFARTADWDEGFADTRWETREDQSAWTVYDSEDQAILRTSPESFPPEGLAANSSGRVVRLDITRFFGIGRFRAYQG